MFSVISACLSVYRGPYVTITHDSTGHTGPPAQATMRSPYIAPPIPRACILTCPYLYTLDLIIHGPPDRPLQHVQVCSLSSLD